MCGVSVRHLVASGSGSRAAARPPQGPRHSGMVRLDRANRQPLLPASPSTTSIIVSRHDASTSQPRLTAYCIVNV